MTSDSPPLPDELLALRSLLSSSPDLIFFVDRDGRFLHVSNQGALSLGLTPEKIIGHTWIEVGLPPERDREFALERAEVLDRGETIRREVRLGVGAEERVFDSSVIPVLDRNGNAVAVMVVSRDITQQTRAEERLRKEASDQKRSVEELKRREEQLVKTNAVIHTVGQVSQRLSAELNLEKVLETVTDAATQLTGAQFGAFFYNATGDGDEFYSIHAVSGVPRDVLERLPLPLSAGSFMATFNRATIHRSDDVRTDPKYEIDEFVAGLQRGHLPVASYLGVPVVSRSGEVLGALVFGHAASGIFTEESEQIAAGLASQAAIAVDNARLFESATRSTAEIMRGWERYRTLATATAQIVWSAAPTGEVVADSPSWRKITGQLTNEFLGCGWLAAIHPDDQTRAWSAWTESIANALPFESEYRLRSANGSYRWFATRAYPVRDPDGTVREWIGAASDIDDKRRSEEAAAFIAEAATLLSSSLAYEVTLRILATLVVPRLADCCAIDMVSAHDTYERVAVAHVDPSQEARFWEADRKRASRSPLVDPVAAVLASGEPLLLDDPSNLESVNFGDGTGSDEPVGARSMLIVPMIARGRTLGSISLLFTVSDRRYSRRDLPFLRDLARSAAVAVDNARLYTEAQAANRAKDQFLATLSHELRTPMTAVLGWAQLLRIGGLDEAMFREAIETIEKSSQIQAEMIDDILDVSRINVGKLRLDVGPVDLPEVIDAALDTVRQAARGKAISIEANLDRSVSAVQGDPNRLQQVFWNLLSNAVKFTAAGGRIDVALDRAGGSARVRVSDNGRGIAPDFVPHVFELFRQADSSTTRVFGGLGLGLAIVRQIVELHGGSVSATSEGLDRGATFTVLLPLASIGAADNGLDKLVTTRSTS